MRTAENQRVDIDSFKAGKIGTQGIFQRFLIMNESTALN